ncbi:hypothetical protein M2352_002706 [Azospirillum fermentarium]|uniref:hypothetical protein n=1 Tax=Azospirillum fermentarium TaxID=1233114 RepID=UPI002227C47E|nr:hypothetical protein [Azospirillum fermentarium]MCW2247115.1 hypothetical protein [Azospirillum fermentarium]
MTSVKISELPAAADLTGAELVPAVQSGTTVRTAVSSLRAGLAAADLSNVTAATFAARAQSAGITPVPPTPLSTALPAALGTAAAGTAADAARGDHVHPLPTPATLGAAAATHAHAVTDTAGLQAALDAKLAQGRHTLWLPAAAFLPRTTSGAGWGMAETSTARIVRRTLDFDPATQEHAQTTVAMPKSWDRGTVAFQVLWLAAAGLGGVVWGMQAMAVGDGDALDAAFGTAVTVTDAVNAANAVNAAAESGALTVAGPPLAGDLVVFQLYRAASDAADTLATDALLLGVRLFITLSAATDA